MTQIKIHTTNGELLIVEVKEKCFNLGLSGNILFYDTNDSADWEETNIILDSDKYSILGHGLLKFITDDIAKEYVDEVFGTIERSVNIQCFENYDDLERYHTSAKQSFLSLLQANGCDIDKNYVILKIK